MHFLASFALASTVTASVLPSLRVFPRDADFDPCTAPATNASVDLGNWLACSVNHFFPYPANGDWASAYDEVFSPSVLASFNGSRFDFNGFKTLYTGVNKTIGTNFQQFDHGFLSIYAAPNSNGDKGGFAQVTGWEGGRTRLGTDIWYTDGAFAVIEDIGGGKRQIVEFRESSNIPNTGALPPTQNWACSFPDAY
ncbi:hypothetical protein BT69DRAFT_1347078 [Atractiella rhizophila]|nr:hypothetical protein BT69DRAFT_1347078 [Atractiella rhizophila]